MLSTMERNTEQARELNLCLARARGLERQVAELTAALREIVENIPDSETPGSWQYQLRDEIRAARAALAKVAP